MSGQASGTSGAAAVAATADVASTASGAAAVVATAEVAATAGASLLWLVPGKGKLVHERVDVSPGMSTYVCKPWINVSRAKRKFGDTLEGMRALGLPLCPVCFPPDSNGIGVAETACG